MIDPRLYDVSRLSLAERAELEQLHRQHAAAPEVVDLARLNVLLGRATRPEETYRMYRQRGSLRRHQRG